MNSHLNTYNKEHFAQAQGTPFTINPLLRDLQHHGLSPSGASILKGTYSPPDEVDNITQLLLRHMQTKCSDIPQPDITLSEFKQVFQKWRECTSTSPSGRHLGPLKSLTHTVDTEDWFPSTSTPQQIFESIYQILLICVRQCIPLERWLTVHNMLIQKEPGNQKIHRMRVIHIQEGDWQAFLKLTITRKTI